MKNAVLISYSVLLCLISVLIYIELCLLAETKM